jgi:hypothetical protein
MADGFDEHRDKLANFEDDLVDLCYDIIDASYDTGNAYTATLPDVLTGKYAAPADYIQKVQQANPTPTPSDFDTDEFNHATFRDDISDLAQVELPIFLDGGADPAQFDEVVARLGRASQQLDLASGYTGLEELILQIEKWEGDAAYNFQRSILPSFGISIVHQLVFIDDLVAAALCIREVIQRTRADALGLAEDLLKKIDPTVDTKFGLESLLWVAGAIAGGIAAFGAAGLTTAVTVATRVSYSITTASSALGNVQKLSGGEAGDRTIDGSTAYEFIPSCLDHVQNVLKAGTAEAEAVMAALKSDLSGDGPDLMCISKPKVIDAKESIMGNADNEDFALLDAENKGHDFVVDAIADLRYAGIVTLPTMAYYFDKAYGEVANLGYPFDAGMGSATVVSGITSQVDTAIEALATAFQDTRDYLYNAGVALKDIADTYFEAESDHEAMMNNFSAQLAEYEDGGALPAYAPQAPSPSTDR